MLILSNFSTEHFPCSVNNGGCDQTCVTVDSYTESCECNTGYKLLSDEKSCAGNVYIPCYTVVTKRLSYACFK